MQRAVLLEGFRHEQTSKKVEFLQSHMGPHRPGDGLARGVAHARRSSECEFMQHLGDGGACDPSSSLGAGVPREFDVVRGRLVVQHEGHLLALHLPAAFSGGCQP